MEAEGVQEPRWGHQDLSQNRVRGSTHRATQPPSQTPIFLPAFVPRGPRKRPRNVRPTIPSSFSFALTLGSPGARGTTAQAPFLVRRLAPPTQKDSAHLSGLPRLRPARTHARRPAVVASSRLRREEAEGWWAPGCGREVSASGLSPAGSVSGPRVGKWARYAPRQGLASEPAKQLDRAVRAARTVPTARLDAGRRPRTSESPVVFTHHDISFISSVKYDIHA